MQIAKAERLKTKAEGLKYQVLSIRYQDWMQIAKAERLKPKAQGSRLYCKLKTANYFIWAPGR